MSYGNIIVAVKCKFQLVKVIVFTAQQSWKQPRRLGCLKCSYGHGTEAYLHIKWHLDASSSLATIEMGRKLGRGLCPVPPYLERGAGPYLAQCGLDRGPSPCKVPSWSIQPFGHNRHRPKIGGSVPFSVPFLGRGSWVPSNTMSLGPRPISLPCGILIRPAIWPQQIWAENWGALPLWGMRSWVLNSPSNTMWPGMRPTCMPSFILIHPTIWPQYTNITDRTGQTGQTDKGLIA